MFFGDPMVSWRERMPAGMLLKSTPVASNIDAPQPGHTLLDFCHAMGGPRHESDWDLIPVETFSAYGLWFQERLVPARSTRRHGWRRRWPPRTDERPPSPRPSARPGRWPAPAPGLPWSLAFPGLGPSPADGRPRCGPCPGPLTGQQAGPVDRSTGPGRLTRQRARLADLSGAGLADLSGAGG
ncbi:hypothetical protein SANTM175S_04682 [Streptomyces antimycoticus]